MNESLETSSYAGSGQEILDGVMPTKSLPLLQDSSIVARLLNRQSETLKASFGNKDHDNKKAGREDVIQRQCSMVEKLRHDPEMSGDQRAQIETRN